MTEKNAGFIFLHILEFEAKLDWKVVFFFSLCLDESFLIQASLDRVLGREVTLFFGIVFSRRLERILKAQKQGF